MIASIFLIMTRLTQLLFLIPMLGMTAYLIHGYVQANTLTPDYILVIFIVTVLANVWAAGTLLFYAVARKAGRFLALVDLGIVAGLIGSVAALRGITTQDCGNVPTDGYYALHEVPFIYNLGEVCGLLKASFGFAIIEIFLFAWSFILALFVEHHHNRQERKKEERTVTTTEYRRRSGSNRDSRSQYRDSYYSGSRAPSRAPSRARSSSRQRNYRSSSRSYA